MNKNWIPIIAAIGGILLVLPSFNSIGKTEFEKRIAEVRPAGSTSDMKVMAASIHALANIVARNPEVRVEERIDSDPGAWLKKTLELSFSKGFNFKEKYPELHSVISDWYDKNIQDGISSEELVNRWHELAYALEK